MKRNYTDGIKEDVKFFIGTEVEHTPAFGMKTLFVVGLQSIEEIQKLLDDPFTSIKEPVRHIFFGANQSYDPVKNSNWGDWDVMIQHFLEKEYLCTLDIPLTAVEGFNDGGLCEYTNFIPQISVKLPYVRLWNYNTMIKIDDRDFNSTNPGVWCHSLHTLMDRNCFTDWTKYSKDTVLK